MIAIHTSPTLYPGMTQGLTADIRALYRVWGDTVIAFRETHIGQNLPLLYFHRDGRVYWHY
jgi:hypothetical protein